MSEVTIIKLNKKKFSDFDDPRVSESTLSTSYVVGYSAATATKKNIRVNLQSLADVIGGGGGGGQGATVPQVIYSYNSSIEGTTTETVDDVNILVIDAKKFANYIQLNNLYNSNLLNPNQTVTNQKGEEVTVTTLDICFQNTTLGSAIKIYLPNFGPNPEYTTATQPYALRLWRRDPLVNEVLTQITGTPVLVFISDPISGKAPQKESKYYDWFSKFLVLGIVEDDGTIDKVARTQEIINLYNDDEISGE